MRSKPLKSPGLILSPSKDEAKDFRQPAANALMIIEARLGLMGLLILPVEVIGCVSWVDFFSSQRF